MRVVVEDLDVEIAGKPIFSGLSTTIEGPRTVAIMGPSGSGKSTLLGVIAGQILPKNGRVDFVGVYSQTQTPRIDWVYQSSPMLLRRSILDNVQLGAWRESVELEDARRSALSVLSRLGIAGLASSRAVHVSGGERQRASIARGMLARADILLVDEPTAALDLASREAVCDALSAAADAGTLLVIATHDGYVAERCDLVYRIEALQLRRER